jgi:hypothetical protein
MTTTPRSSLRRLMAGLLALALACLAIAFGTVAPASAAGSDVTLTDSAVTVSGTGPFADLKVTVAQTDHLINQAVGVTWTGGSPTSPVSRYGIQYLQIMQCWGDDPTGPTREQCQFGGILGDSRGGAQSSTRQVSYGPTLVDPLETLVTDPNSFINVYVPFDSVTGKTTDGSRSEFFDAGSTNEIPYGRTSSNGTGEQLFEMQTEREAPGLGCGGGTPHTTPAGTEGRSCWLIIVPRNNLEVDGSQRSGTSAFSLDSSPLSATNWSHRIIVPLHFEPLGAICAFGKERKLAGHELVVEAITRWQPELCANGGATYSYSQVSDSLGRRQLVSPEPDMVLTSRPVVPAAVPPTRPITYAPVSVAGVAIAFLVERQTTTQDPADLARDGTRVLGIKLTPRLVAKLLTQSYVRATPVGNPAVRGNPQVITSDPDFIALNPEFAKLGYTTPGDALVPLGDSDVAELLWQWINADKDARAWIDGKADPWGMKVNPAFKKAALPFENFPQSDPYCSVTGGSVADLCALERRPYAADFHDAARSASRGDALIRETWDPLSTPAAWKKSDPQFAGTRAVFAVTDTATAARFGLQVAKLRNASGAFVAPSTTSMGSALAAMKDSDVKGVLAPDVRTKKATAYPLTLVTYAATAPAALTRQEGKDYAAFLRYAAGDGQKPGVEPGELPDGYLPLTSALRAQTRAVATEVDDEAGVPVAAPSTATDDTDTSDGGGSSGGTGTGTTPSDGASPTPSASPSATASPPAVAAPNTTAVVSLTPDDPVGPARYALVAALVLGSLAALTGLALLRISARAP